MAYAYSDHRPVTLPSCPELGSGSPPTGSDSHGSCTHSGGTPQVLEFNGPHLQLCLFLGS